MTQKQYLSSLGVLVDHHDVALLDLDGVVYVGSEAVPGAVDALAAARRSGQRHRYVTNNASRSADVVASHLRALGIQAEASDVVTSAAVTADIMRERLPAGASVFVLGGDGVVSAMSGAGFMLSAEGQTGTDSPTTPDEVIDAVVMGFGPEVGWRHLAAAAHHVRAGAWFVATNTDLTVPTPNGVAPGNGTLVNAVAAASRPPDLIVGKPEPHLFDRAAASSAAQSAIVVGDRLDTDILGARSAGLASLLVMTGVTSVAEVIAAPDWLRPDYIAHDLSGLLRAHDPVAVPAPGQAQIGSTHVTIAPAGAGREGRIQVQRLGQAGAPDDALRAVVAAAWTAIDVGLVTSVIVDDAVSAAVAQHSTDRGVDVAG